MLKKRFIIAFLQPQYIMDKVINNFKLTGVIALFLWISFFAPIVNESCRFWFFVVLIIFLSVLLFIDRQLYKLIFSREEIPFWIFLAALMAGIVNAVESVTMYRHFWSYIFPIPFLYFFAKITFKIQNTKYILRVVCFMAFVLCLYGIIEFSTRNNIIYEKYLTSLYYETYKGIRMMSIHMHPISFGTYLLAIFPLAYVLFLKEEKRFFKIAAFIYAVTIAVCIILVFSRGALIGLLTSVFIMTSFFIRRKKIVFILWLILFCIFLVWVSSVLLGYNNFAFWRYSLRYLSSWEVYLRKIIRFSALEAILKDHLFFGIGFGHYRVLFDHYLPAIANITEYDQKIADCMYITILAEAGIVGLGGFLIFIFSILKRSCLKLKANLTRDNRLLLIGFLSGLAGIMCTFLTYDTLYWIVPSYIFWSYTGILSLLSAKKCL
ncbi:MAG: hypothetical protein A2047_00335 [Omnitrophica bacterium GWA2_41_15]|nr:MAG: hypothetical protein A2047_00335 [Omnitrophica bacterium GWA2_41_15]HAZ10974.1 hypothetical protein [Candidatus Omnitrophota bacterium]